MNGTVIPQTPIAVDFWQIRQCPWVKFFFLSHLHSDHTKGLTSSWSQPIYCSPLTGRLLVHTLQVQAELIRPLEVNTSHMITLDDLGEETMVVTVIDANHCPGSVMFLFEGYFGTILYTGDFRYEMLSGLVPLDLLKSKTIDVLYLDNTYCDPCCQFPPRSESKQQVINIIAQHPDHNVIIALRNLGKEQLLVDLATHFKTWIVVSKTQLEKLKILELPNVFTTDPGAGFIRVEPFHHLSSKKIQSWNNHGRTLVILPTSLFTGLNMQPYSNCPGTHVVAYSDHSSYLELHAFVCAIAPKQVKPIVSGSSHGVFGMSVQNRTNMSCFTKYLNSDPQTPIKVPLCVRKLMKLVYINKTGAWKRKAKPLFLHVKRHQHLRGINFDDQDSTSRKSLSSSSSSDCDDKHSLDISRGDDESDSCESVMAVVKLEPVSSSLAINIDSSDNANQSVNDYHVSSSSVMGDQEHRLQNCESDLTLSSTLCAKVKSTDKACDENMSFDENLARGILADDTATNIYSLGNTGCNISSPNEAGIKLATTNDSCDQGNASSTLFHNMEAHLIASTKSHLICQKFTDTDCDAVSYTTALKDISNTYNKDTSATASGASTEKHSSSTITSTDRAAVVTPMTYNMVRNSQLTMVITSVKCVEAHYSYGSSSEYQGQSFKSVVISTKTSQQHLEQTGQTALYPDITNIPPAHPDLSHAFGITSDDHGESSRQIRPTVIAQRTPSRTASVARSPGSAPIQRPLTEIQEVITDAPKETLASYHRDAIRHLPRTPKWQIEQENLIIEQEIKKEKNRSVIIGSLKYCF